jgi:hypothetical protein
LTRNDEQRLDECERRLERIELALEDIEKRVKREIADKAKATTDA